MEARLYACSFMRTGFVPGCKHYPMYAGALIMIAGIPLALSSWFGLIPAALLVPVIGWRLMREEMFLATHLAGYRDYSNRVRYRLVPTLW